MNEYDKEVKTIYDKIMITKTQELKDMEKRSKEELENNFWAYCGKRLENCIMAVVQMYQRKDIPKATIDKAEKEVSEMMDLVTMHTMPEVIDQLTINLAKEKMLEKIKKEEK